MSIDTITVLALLEESAGDNTGAVLHAAAEELAALRALAGAAVELATDVLDTAGGADTIPFDTEVDISGLRKLAAEVLRLAEGR